MEPPDVCYDYDWGYDDSGDSCGSSGAYDEELDCMLQPTYMEEDVSEYHGELTTADYERYKADDDAMFEKMWPTVEAIVRSMQSKPYDWRQDTYTIQHVPSKMVYWAGSSETSPITETFGSGNNQRVFSDKQGKLIRAAFIDRHAYVPNVAQLQTMKAFGTDPKPVVPEPGFWGNLWVAIKFLPTMARFCMARK